MKFLIRTPENCARLFNLFIGLFFVHMVCTLITLFWLKWFFLISLPITVSLIVIFGLLAYQIGYPLLLAVLWCIGLFVPIGNFIVLLVLFIQAKAFLKTQNYKIVLLGARPQQKEEVITDMDQLIKAGKIRMLEQSQATYGNTL